MTMIATALPLNNRPLCADYVYRLATPDDAAGICALQVSLAEDENYLMITPMDPITGTELLKASLEKDERRRLSGVIVAEQNGEIVGLALCRDHVHPSLNGTVQLTLCVSLAYSNRSAGVSSIPYFKPFFYSHIIYNTV